MVRQVAEAVPLAQEAVDELDEAAARLLGLNRTDMRCLSALWRGPVSPSELAVVAGLTRGAITTVLDRLEAVGHVRRVRGLDDRRGVRIEITAASREKAGNIYGPLAQEGQRLLSTYSTRDLNAVLRFLTESCALQKKHARRIGALSKPLTGAHERPRRAKRPEAVESRRLT